MARDPAHARAVGQLLCAALLWSLGGILVKWIDWPPLAVAGGRGLFAAIFLFAIHRHLRFTWSPLQLSAAVAYAMCTFTFVVATKLTTAANAILLQYTAPIWVALLAASFLGERTTRSDWVAIGITFAGMATLLRGCAAALWPAWKPDRRACRHLFRGHDAAHAQAERRVGDGVDHPRQSHRLSDRAAQHAWRAVTGFRRVDCAHRARVSCSWGSRMRSTRVPSSTFRRSKAYSSPCSSRF